MPFDPDSGLVYAERIAHLSGCSHTTEHQSPYAENPYRDSPEQGANTLLDTSMAAFMRNLKFVEAETLRSLPKATVEMLWRHITRSGADSLHAWQVFALTGHFDRKLVKHFKSTCIACSARLLGLEGTKTMGKTVPWLTTLTLCNNPYTTAQMMHLVKLDSLRNLYIQTDGLQVAHDSALSDRILREWANEARHHGAFSNLQTLFVDCQREVTFHSLQHLKHFPALLLFCVRGGRVDYAGEIKMSRMEIAKHLIPMGWRFEDASRKGSMSDFMERQRFRTQVAQQQLPYINSSTRRFWPDVVHEYLHHRAGLLSEDDCPVLDVHVSGRSSRHSSKPAYVTSIGAADQIICIERAGAAQLVDEQAQESQPTVKRRKIREQKSIASDELLGRVVTNSACFG